MEEMEECETELEYGGFRTVVDIDSCTEKVTVFRANIKTKSDADMWLTEYGKAAKSQWIVYDTYPSLQRVVYRKQYICAFSKKNKTLEEDSNRNWNCKAKLDIKIKLLTKDTRKKDKFLKEDPLQGVITVTKEHSHNSETFTALRFMRPGNEVMDTFFQYFKEGTTPGAAIQLHASKLKVLADGGEKVGNGHFMPLDQTVYYWHRLYRELNYGSPAAPFETLRAKIELYREQGVTVVIREEHPWAVVIVTPVMKRAQDAFWTENIVYWDTSSSCDSTSTNVTVMLTATKAGAVPITVLLHEGQSTESYQVAFELFQATCPRAFGGKKQPKALMSDNSPAEKNAFGAVWQDTEQLLCGFHVGMAEWDWIHSNVAKENRKTFMSLFKKVQYAKSTEELEEAIDNLKTTAPEYYERRVKGLLVRAKEWVQLFRAEMQIGGSHTNNYSEANIRVLKDIVLGRMKAFSMVALVDYVAVTWVAYLELRLSWFAYNRKSKPMHLYTDLVKRLPAELADQIECLDDDLYLVPSGTTPELKYEVQVSMGLCNCKAGAAGAFCKHQALVHHKFGGAFPNCPPVTSADRYLLGVLAMGEKCPKKSLFLGMKETLDDLERGIEELKGLYSSHVRQQLVSETQGDEPPVVPLHPASRPSSPTDEPADDPEANQNIREEFLKNINKVMDLGSETNSKRFYKFMERANKGMKEISNSNKAFEAMMKMAHVMKATSGRSGKQIKVQPRSIARRRQGLTKGNARVAEGRPSKYLPNGSKRKRSLAASIKEGKRHVRKH